MKAEKIETSEHQEEIDEEEEKLPIQPFKYYLKSAVTFKIIDNCWG